MVRRNDWASRMFDVVSEHQNRDFEWGGADCCLFVARVIDAMTDSDLEVQICTRYSDEPSALRFIAEHGSLEDAVSFYLGDIVSGSPQRGDAVLIHGGEDFAMGICLGGTVAGMGPNGLKLLPLSEVIGVWRV